MFKSKPKYSKYYEDAVKFVIERGLVSASLLQQQFNLGYLESAKLIDELEENEIIGPFNGRKPREILVTKTK